MDLFGAPTFFAVDPNLSGQRGSGLRKPKIEVKSLHVKTFARASCLFVRAHEFIFAATLTNGYICAVWPVYEIGGNGFLVCLSEAQLLGLLPRPNRACPFDE